MGYLRIDNIGNIGITATPHRALSRVTLGLDVPGGWGEHASNGVSPETLELSGVISCRAYPNAALAFQQLCEIVNNPALDFHYFNFPAPWEDHSGWYVIDSLDPGAETPNEEYPFSLRATRVGIPGSHQRGTFFEAGEETYTGWGAGTLTATEAIGLPNGATDPLGCAIYETRIAQGGSVPILHNPTRQDIGYSLPTAPASWYRAECAVFDTIHRGDTTERNWARVFSPRHTFSGDIIIQNGLLRFWLDLYAGIEYCYMWDSVSTTNAWLLFAQHKLDFDGAGKVALLKRAEITQLTPEVVAWRETRQYSTDVATFNCSLRRGMRFARVALRTHTRAIDEGKQTGLTLYSGGSNWFSKFFNDGDSKTDGAGDCAPGAANYELAYAAGRNVLAGFLLFNLPAVAQPYDSAGTNDYVASSLAWDVGDTYSYCITAIPFAVAGLPGTLAAARAAGLLAAQEAMWYITPSAILLPPGHYV